MLVSPYVCFLHYCFFGDIAVAASVYQSDIISESDCCELAEYWISLQYDETTYVEEVIPITDGEDIIAFCVNFSNGCEPCGYIVVDSYRHAVYNITEFCLSGEGIYENLCNYYGRCVSYGNGEKIIYSTGLFDYAIMVNHEERLFYDSVNGLLEADELHECCARTKDLRREAKENSALGDETTFAARSNNQEFFGGFFDSDDLPSTVGYTYKMIRDAYSFVPSTMADYRVTNGFPGNCTPTAAANLLSFYMEKRGFGALGINRQNIYSRIVSASGWNQLADPETGSGMSFAQAKVGMKNVVTSADYSFTGTNYLLNTWSNWKRDLANDYPVLTAVYGYTWNNGGWEAVGHSVVAIGYKEFESGARYLVIWDGWNYDERFLLFDSGSFSSVDGMCVKVTD